MTPNPFEDPIKAELRSRAIIAIDAVGHQVIEPVRVDLPQESKLNASLLGDCQSLNGEEQRYIYYIRTNGDSAIPQWLANFAKAAHALPNCHLYVVVASSSQILEKSCRMSGAGLLRLTEDNLFEHLIDFDELDARKENSVFIEQVSTQRRRMEMVLDIKVQTLKDHHSKVQELTVGLGQGKRDEYLVGILSGIQRWTDWGVNISRKLDEAAGAGDPNLLEVAKRMIDEGADEDEVEIERAETL